jgi:hypothetical protein
LKLSRKILAALALSVFLLAGCGGSEPTPSPAPLALHTPTPRPARVLNITQIPTPVPAPKRTYITWCPDCRAAGMLANIWKAPTDNPTRKCVLGWEQEVEVVSTQGIWSQIKGPGCDGWITTKLLKAK